MGELLDAFQLSEKLKIHYTTLYKMIDDGKIPYIDLGERTRRFDYEEVIRHLKKEATDGAD